MALPRYVSSGIALALIIFLAVLVVRARHLAGASRTQLTILFIILASTVRFCLLDVRAWRLICFFEVGVVCDLPPCVHVPSNDVPDVYRAWLRQYRRREGDVLHFPYVQRLAGLLPVPRAERQKYLPHRHVGRLALYGPSSEQRVFEKEK